MRQAGEIVNAKALRQEQGWFCLGFLLKGRKIEYLLLCLQRVNAGDIVAWDVAFFLGGQAPSLPPFPRSKRHEGSKGSGAEGLPLVLLGPSASA